MAIVILKVALIFIGYIQWSPVSVPQSVGIFGASETENVSVAHVDIRLYVFPPEAGWPPSILPAEVVLVEGPVMIKVVKSKRIYVSSILIILWVMIWN